MDVVEYIDYDNLRFGVKLIETDYDANCNEEKIQRMIMKLGSVIVGVHAGEEFHAYKKTFKVLTYCYPHKYPNHAGEVLN